MIDGKMFGRSRKRRLPGAMIEGLESRVMMTGDPALPVIPNRLFNVATYGAVGNGTTDNTAAIQAAINAASTAGGGTVEIPAAAGAYACGPLTLKSSINLQIDTGATLQMLPLGTYPLVSGATSYASLVQATSMHDVEISGGGTIDGQGSAWWTAYSGGSLTATRPSLVGVESCSTVLVSGITLINAPNVHMGFRYISTNVTVDGITIQTPNGTPNTDGIDITGTNVLIQNSSISDGDDNIAFGGRGGGNYTVRNCTFGTGHGLSIGSFTGGGLNGLTVTNCSFNGTLNGIQGKSNRTRGGLVQNLSYSNLVMVNVTNPILFDDYYFIKPHPPTTDPAQAITADTPYWNNISVSNLNASGAGNSLDLWGLPEAPITNFTMSGVTSIGTVQGNIYHATGVNIVNSTISPSYLTYDAGITVTGGGPSIATAAHASATTVTGTTVGLSVLGSDPAGEGNLTYTWTPVGRLAGPVTFSTNGTNAAKATTATFSKAGTYVFLVVAADALGYTTTSTVTVTVNSTGSSIAVTPGSAAMVPSAGQTFSAVEMDQFGAPLASQPTFTWAATAGTITSGGAYTAPITDAQVMVTASAGSVSGTASVNVAVAGTVVWTVNPALAASATNYLTIQSAIDAVPAGNITPYDIQIAPGTYNERLNIAAGKDFVTLDGGNGVVTVQGGNDGDSTALVTAAASNFTVVGVTFNDTAGQVGPRNALLATGDRQIYVNDSILGYQDTLFLNKGGARSYFQNCTISGSVDFIYGAGTGVFNGCSIVQRVGGVSLTAPATPQSSAYGLVFINSHLVNGGTITAGSTALARAWNAPYGAAAYIHTNMDNMISAVGWTNFSGTNYTATERYSEYGSYGAGAAGYLASPSQRASQAVSLTAAQAAMYANVVTWAPNFANLFNGWDPTALGGDVPVVYTGSNGVWETGSNWNINAAPSAGQAVFVRSGSVTLASAAGIDSLTIGTSSGGATVTVSAAGNLAIGGLLTTAGTSGSGSRINDNGTINATSIVIGNTADQVHILNNGTFVATASLTGAWPAGSIYVDQGTLHIPNLGGYASGPIVDVGNVAGSSGTWAMGPGDVQYPQAVNTGAGTSTISITGGTLNGTWGPSLGALGAGGTVVMNQSGGTVSFINGNLGAARGTYTFNLTGGTFQGTATGYDWLLGDATNANSTWNTSGAATVVALNDLFIGKNGNGTFNQSGGSVTINQTDSAQLASHGGMKLGWAANGTGTCVVSGGTLAVQNGGMSLGYDPASGTSYGVGTLRVSGAAGSVAITGNFAESSHSVVAFDVQAGGVSAVNVTGNVSFAAGATISPALSGGAYGSYTLMNWTGSMTGTPALSAAAVSAGWTLAVVNQSLVATLLAPVPGDANGDRAVDLADYDIWYAHVGTPVGAATPATVGDFNADGNIDLADYDVWYAHVGPAPALVAGASSAELAGAAVTSTAVEPVATSSVTVQASTSLVPSVSGGVSATAVLNELDALRVGRGAKVGLLLQPVRKAEVQSHGLAHDSGARGYALSSAIITSVEPDGRALAPTIGVGENPLGQTLFQV